MIIGIIGLLGAGKTLLLTYLGYKYKNKGYTVYSNYECSFAEPLDLTKLITMEVENAVLLLDEIHTLLDSREFSSDPNKILSYFYLQSRKKNVHVLYTTQLARLVDVRLRNITDMYIIAFNQPDRFKYEVYILEHKVSTFYISKRDAEQYFKLYNTKHIVKPRTQITYEELRQLYAKARNREVFAELVHSKYPHISKNKAKVLYTMISNSLKKEVVETANAL